MATRVLKEFVIDKIAAVDRPCQEGAQVTIMKRAPDVDPEAVAKQAVMEAAQRGLVKLKLALLTARVAKAGMVIEGYDVGGKKKPKSRSPFAKAWSDKAREASIEARRHKSEANAHNRSSNETVNDPAKAKAHIAAAGAHREAQLKYESAVRHYKAKQGELAASAHQRAGALGAVADKRSDKLL